MCVRRRSDLSELTDAMLWAGDSIEALVLPGENGPEMRAELNRWFAFYGATSSVIVWMIVKAFQELVKVRRIRHLAALTRQSDVNWARDEWDNEQDHTVQWQARKLALAPASAVRELQGFAAGCRWLINRWQRLKGRIVRDGTLYGGDRDEAICLQGGIPALDRLCESDAAVLTWGCCLFAQPQPQDDEIAAFVAVAATSSWLRGVEPSRISPPRLPCRKWLLARIDGELTRLRQREEQLWVEHEEPARTRAVERELAAATAQLQLYARYEKTAKASLKRHLTAVAQECKRYGIAVPPGLPYKSL